MQKKKSFSLLEVLVAMSIIAIGVMAVMSLYPSVMRQFKLSSALTEAGLFAEDKFNQIKTFEKYESDSGVAGHINWTLSIEDVSLPENITLKKMILEAKHPFFKNNKTEEFVTYVK